MARRIILLLAVSTCLAPGPMAFAGLNAFWVPVASGDGSLGSTYPAAAVTLPAGDPLLLQMQTWDLVVTTSGDWSAAQLRATLAQGNFFYRRFADGTANAGLSRLNPVLLSVFPNARFWSYVTSPADLDGDAIFIHGGFPPGQPLSNGSEASAEPGVFSCRWGDFVLSLPSSADGYPIARLTFPLSVLPQILTADPGSNASSTSQVNPALTTLVPQIPEPFAGLMGAVFVLIGGRWRRPDPRARFRHLRR